MNFLETIFRSLERSANRTVLQEIRGDAVVNATGGELLADIETARRFLRSEGLRKGSRCALIAPNSIRWAALDLAILAEGGIAVPLYARQVPDELARIMQDCSPSLICCGDVSLRTNLIRTWPDAPPVHTLKEIFGGASAPAIALEPLCPLTDSGPVTIIYTSGTSGEPKGVVLSAGNVNHMLRCTTARLDLLIGRQREPERVFHYGPFSFAASWILLLSCLSRNALLSLSTDLSQVAKEMRLAAPHYYLNVPLMLERVKARIEEQLAQRGGLVSVVFRSAERAYLRQQTASDAIWLAMARMTVFPAIRKRLGPNLKALICGSAPLARETQLFFGMLGVPVLQVYGLTETTAICTMDHPAHVEPGFVGPAIDGVEMKRGEQDEILVRGPNVFLGYWNRPQATAEAMQDGWFHTGDQGEVNERGNWRITGRVKNILVPASGHKVAPEPIEEMLLRTLPGAQQVVLLGNGRSFLTAVITGTVSRDQVSRALDEINPQLPHYKRVHAFHIAAEPFSFENGLLTAMGKLKRDAIAARYQQEVDALYARQPA